MSDEQRVLVVDDDVGMREGIRRVLEAEGFEVAAAADGQEALEIFEQRRGFAAALVDLQMPRVGGLDLIEQLREQDEDIVLLVITAHASIDTAIQAARRGSYDYVPKPFTPEQLLLPLLNGLERRRLTREARRLQADREERLLELGAERSKCTTIIECMTDPVVVVNREREIVLRNAAAARALPGCDEVRFATPLAALDLPELAAILDEALDATAAHVIVSRELAVGDRTYLAHAGPVREPTAGLLGAVAVLRDVTEIEGTVKARALFVSVVAHAVGATMAGIEQRLDEIAACDDRARARELAATAKARSAALRATIAELNGLSSVETGALGLKRTELDLAEAVAEAAQACRHDALHRGIDLSFQHDEPAPQQRVLADRQAIVRAFVALIDYALRAAPDRGHVAVRVLHSGLYARASVRHDGAPMPQDEQDRLLDGRRCLPDEPPGDPRLGLGPALARRLLALHHGRLSVHSAQGEGTTFEARLPLIEMADDDELR